MWMEGGIDGLIIDVKSTSSLGGIGWEYSKFATMSVVMSGGEGFGEAMDIGFCRTVTDVW